VVCASIPQEERSIWQFDQVQKVVDEKWESLEPAETSRSGLFTRLHDIWQYQACPLSIALRNSHVLGWHIIYSL
jgi:hypothetical protein